MVPIYQGSSGAETDMEPDADQAADADQDAEEEHEWHDSLDSSEITDDLSEDEIDDLYEDESAHHSETSTRQGEGSRATPTGESAGTEEAGSPDGADDRPAMPAEDQTDRSEPGAEGDSSPNNAPEPRLRDGADTPGPDAAQDAPDSEPLGAAC